MSKNKDWEREESIFFVCAETPLADYRANQIQYVQRVWQGKRRGSLRPRVWDGSVGEMTSTTKVWGKRRRKDGLLILLKKTTRWVPNRHQFFSQPTRKGAEKAASRLLSQRIQRRRGGKEVRAKQHNELGRRNLGMIECRACWEERKPATKKSRRVKTPTLLLGEKNFGRWGGVTQRWRVEVPQRRGGEEGTGVLGGKSLY